ncbi:unnamed protein product, partial [Effrenium voratum]
RLNQDLRGVESRQVLLDRRLVELDSQLQALQEQQFAQSFAAERGQRAVALGAHRALQTAKELSEEGEWNKCMEGLGVENDSQRRIQEELQACWRRVEELGERMEVRLSTNGFAGPSDGSRLDTRLSALEQSHRKLAMGAQRALKMALSVHEKQEGLEMEEEFERCFGKDLDPGPDVSHQLSEQDHRLEQILLIVDALADRVSDTGASLQALADREAEGKAEHHPTAVAQEELRDKVEELEANLYGLAAQVQSQVDQRGRVATLRLMDQQQERQQQRSLENLAMALEGLDARLERNLAEQAQKLHDVQDGQDEQQVTLRQLVQELPEVSKRLEQLWEQCQLYFPRLQEQEVHFGFLRASFEAHKQQMLDMMEEKPRSLLPSPWRDKKPREVAAIEGPE